MCLLCVYPSGGLRLTGRRDHYIPSLHLSHYFCFQKIVNSNQLSRQYNDRKKKKERERERKRGQFSRAIEYLNTVTHTVNAGSCVRCWAHLACCTVYATKQKKKNKDPQSSLSSFWSNRLLYSRAYRRDCNGWLIIIWSGRLGAIQTANVFFFNI